MMGINKIITKLITIETATEFYIMLFCVIVLGYCIFRLFRYDDEIITQIASWVAIIGIWACILFTI